MRIREQKGRTMKRKRIGRRILPMALSALFAIQSGLVIAGTVKEEPADPIHHCTGKNDGTDITDWKYVYFGSYPQTEVTKSALATEIAGAAYDANHDAWVNGKKYRRVQRSDANYDAYFGDGEYRYFRWERIRWRVLKDDGNTLYMMADRALDCKDYHDEYVSVTWEESTLSKWLNQDFYETAFSKKEQNAVVLLPYVKDLEGQAQRNCRVGLLSAKEVTDPAYGFCEKSGVWSVSRWIQASDYAHAMGVYAYGDSYTGGNENCFWWLRTQGGDEKRALSVHNYGYLGGNGDYVDDNNNACAPVVRIDKSSEAWFVTDDGTSGEGGGMETDPGDNGEQKPQDTENPGENTETVQKPDTGGDTGGKKEEGDGKADEEQKIKVKKVSIRLPSKKLAAGKRIKLKAKVTPSKATDSGVTWGVSNKNATIDREGNLRLKKTAAGKKVTITATANDGSGRSAYCKITIMKNAVKSVKITAPKKSLKAGKTMKLKSTVRATGKKANKALKWISSNPRYATVSKSGKLKAKKAGKGRRVTVMAVSTDGTDRKAEVTIAIK